MKRKWLLSLAALVPAVLLPLASVGQVAPDRAPRPDSGVPVFKYQVFVGIAYTSLNQVNQSRYGLVGVEGDFNVNFGRYFALTADGAYFPGSFQAGIPAIRRWPTSWRGRSCTLRFTAK